MLLLIIYDVLNICSVFCFGSAPFCFSKNKTAPFLLKSQKADGSWLVESRSKPFQKYFETGFPHGVHQFVSTSATAWATIALLETLSKSDSK